jgi:hypothetical protein
LRIRRETEQSRPRGNSGRKMTAKPGFRGHWGGSRLGAAIFVRGHRAGPVVADYPFWSQYIPRSANLGAMAVRHGRRVDDGWSGERPCRRITPRLLTPSPTVPGLPPPSRYTDLLIGSGGYDGPLVSCCRSPARFKRETGPIGVLDVFNPRCQRGCPSKTSCLVFITAFVCG